VVGLPGWNSIQTTGALAQLFFWISIAALVLVGIAQVLSYRYGEQHDLMANQQHAAQQRAADEHVALLHRKVSVLTTKVEQARASTADANARAEETEQELAGANDRAQGAQQALLRLKAPRTLSEEALRNFKAALKPFAGQPWAVTTFWELKEPVNFATLLFGPLNSAGWKYDDSGRKGLLPEGLAGVEVLVQQRADTKVKAAATALVAALNKYGFNAAMKLMTNSEDLDKIQINVGMKSDLANL
jgi:type IV secretory pathway VirB6-like protein